MFAEIVSHIGICLEGSAAETYCVDTRVVQKVMSNFFFFACELGIVDEGECGGR